MNTPTPPMPPLPFIGSMPASPPFRPANDSYVPFLATPNDSYVPFLATPNDSYVPFLATPNPDGTIHVAAGALHPNDPKGASGAAKAQLHLLPSVALVAGANVLKLGARKYGAFNFRDANVNATTYVSAIMRHLAAWNDGEDTDPESGESHIAHIMANCCIVLDAQAHGTLLDDRWKPTDTAGQ